MQFLVFADCCMWKGGICMLLTCSYWRTKKQQYIRSAVYKITNAQCFFKVTPKTLS